MIDNRLIVAGLLLAVVWARVPEVSAENGALAHPGGRLATALVAPHRASIRLDGDHADWEGIPFVTVTPAEGVFDAEVPPADSADDLSFRFAVCHDDDALFVAVEVTDDAIFADSSKPGDLHAPAWDDDAIEVFIDGNHNHAPNARVENGSELRFGGEFSLIANGAAMSGFSGFPRTFGKAQFWQGATNWARVGRGEKLVRYEFRLTWRVMGGQVRPGDTIGFSLAAQDDDNGGRREHSFYWKGISPHAWKNEAGWGDVYLQPRLQIPSAFAASSLFSVPLAPVVPAAAGRSSE